MKSLNQISQNSDANLARTTAHFIDTSRYIWQFNLILSVVNLWFLLQKSLGLGFVLEILFSVLILFCLIRIQFDRRLLLNLAQNHLSLNQLDDALATLKLRPVPSVLRPMHARCLACMRLFYIFCILSLAHLLALSIHFFI